MHVAALLLLAELHVFAASSLTDVLTEIARGYRADRIVFNFAGSGTLARQIEEGAPADLFLSADEGHMDRLQRRALIDGKSRVSPISNALVIATAGAPVRSPRDLLRLGSIAVAEPSSVPAGIYARQWLLQLGLWPRLQPKMIPTENVRAALAVLEAGNVDAAIVFRTDALHSKRVRIAYEVVHGPAISYPFAVVADSSQKAAAAKFLRYLTSPAARAIFARHGFVVR